MLCLYLREEVGPHDSQHDAGRRDRKQTLRSRSSLSGSTSWVPRCQAGTRWRLRKRGLQLPTALGECLVAVDHGGEGRKARGQGWLRGDTEHAACNTPGVYHQLGSRFELKHDRLSGDEPNLNLELHHCFTYRSLFKDICLDSVITISSCVSPWYLSIVTPGKVS
jgi:hypothetical protein